ncbi:hypothetical protein [Tessaracoccus palaemonis]|uniref:Uncharacterized protein n=1 Tax=Tessaracoccus palaemonis TaxID=2829499 RepID=A0ABX8SJ00_9ACTN|nr:hypothetical protein [Tessaracoccus palaemonis]QXT63357.1 hypothetical protein KDB89_02405 [Tessaracoccus palaemonis]
MSHRRRTPSLIAALVLCLGMLGTAPSARADANEELGEGQKPILLLTSRESRT